jgi:uncharacterized protein YoxC
MIRDTVNALLACLVTFVLCAVAYSAAVNVLLMNLALDEPAPGPTHRSLQSAASPRPALPWPPLPQRWQHHSDSLSSRLDKLEKRFDAALHSNAAIEVEALRARVDKIAEDLRPAAASVRRIDELFDRVANLARDVDAVRSEMKHTKGGDPSAESDKKIQAIGVEVQSLKGSIMRLEAARRDARAQPPGPDLREPGRLGGFALPAGDHQLVVKR